jgi:hypothetical protein
MIQREEVGDHREEYELLQPNYDMMNLDGIIG